MHILVIKPSSFGDVIHGLQVIQTLKEQRKDVRVTWVIADGLLPLVASCKTVDEVLVFHRKGGVGGFVKLIKQVRKTRYDYVLDLQGLARSGILTLLSKSNNKLGRQDAREGARWVYQKTAPLPAGNAPHAIDILLQFLRFFDIEPKLTGCLHFENKILENRFQKWDKPPILLFPNSRRPEKEWPYFDNLTEQLLKDFPGRPIVWLGQEEKPLPQNAAPSCFFNLIGKTTLMELIYLVSIAYFIVANDSGPMHLSAALNKPTVALFGPTLPEQYGPYPLSKPTHCVIRAPNRDLNDLTADSVRKTIFEKLNTYFG